MNPEVFNVALGAVIGALLGSLGTVGVFGGRLVRQETRVDELKEAVTRAEAKAEKSITDAHRAWAAVRDMKGELRGSQRVPRYGESDTGEGPVV